MTQRRPREKDKPHRDFIRELLAYDPETGVFRWRVRRGQRSAGAVAGYEQPKSHYREIRINYRAYLEHRLAWFMHHGEWPINEIDHINGDPTDNRIDNLRAATSAENKRNVRRNKANKTGFKGVCFDKGYGRWRAAIKHNGKTIFLGRYDDPALAHAAYLAAANKYFGEFARAG